MKMPSVMRQGGRFAKVPQANIPRSTFNRSHGYKTTFDQGALIPVLVDEVYPGDTFNVKMTAFARLSTPIKPIMDNMYLDSFFFFVPYRLLWENFKKFLGEQEDPADTISYTIPQQTVPAGGYDTGSLHDYFGLPVGVGAGSPAWSHSCLPTRAYYLIWNEWFRDQNLQDSRSGTGGSGISMNLGNGPDVAPAGGSAVAFRGKRHDYFTSCLPWQQKGSAVTIASANNAPVKPSGSLYPTFYDGTSAPQSAHLEAGANGDTGPVNFDQLAASVDFSTGDRLYWHTTSLEAEIGGVITINEMRESFQIQKLLERSARGGTRYPEVIKAHFGVTDPSHAVLQRPQYLGGGSAPINISSTAQTGPTTDGAGAAGTPQGNLAAIGTMVANNHGFVNSFTEHGVVMGLVSVRCDLSYQQGLERWWSRETRYDMYYPEFAHLGEQAVLNKEIYTQGAAADDNVFGYQERFAEMRYKPSRVTGQFRSNVAGGAASLHIWHLSQDFASLPTLNSVFVTDDLRSEVDRVIATPTEPHLFFDAWFEYICARPLPVYSVPGLIDHL